VCGQFLSCSQPGLVQRNLPNRPNVPNGAFIPNQRFVAPVNPYVLGQPSLLDHWNEMFPRHQDDDE
jgi:hypothetical protein